MASLKITSAFGYELEFVDRESAGLYSTLTHDELRVEGRNSDSPRGRTHLPGKVFSRAEVERLFTFLGREILGTERAAELLADPEPEVPTNFGAVVRSVNGKVYSLGSKMWFNTSGSMFTPTEILHVLKTGGEVIYEGVAPDA